MDTIKSGLSQGEDSGTVDLTKTVGILFIILSLLVLNRYNRKHS